MGIIIAFLWVLCIHGSPFYFCPLRIHCCLAGHVWCWLVGRTDEADELASSAVTHVLKYCERQGGMTHHWSHSNWKISLMTPGLLGCATRSYVDICLGSVPSPPPIPPSPTLYTLQMSEKRVKIFLKEHFFKVLVTCDIENKIERCQSPFSWNWHSGVRGWNLHD